MTLKPAAIWGTPAHNNTMRQAAWRRTKMKANFRVFSFSLCASFVIFWPALASAQSSGANACAILAARITPDISRQVLSDPRLSIFQQLRIQFYLRCLQSHAQQAATGANAAAKPGTFITKAGTFTTFDVRLLPASTRRGRSREFTSMQVASSTASCGLATVPSPRSMPRVPLTVHNPTASTRQGRSSESPLTRTS